MVRVTVSITNGKPRLDKVYHTLTIAQTTMVVRIAWLTMVDVRNHSQPWFGIGFAQKSMVVSSTMVSSTMVNHGQPWLV